MTLGLHRSAARLRARQARLVALKARIQQQITDADCLIEAIDEYCDENPDDCTAQPTIRIGGSKLFGSASILQRCCLPCQRSLRRRRRIALVRRPLSESLAQLVYGQRLRSPLSP